MLKTFVALLLTFCCSVVFAQQTKKLKLSANSNLGSSSNVIGQVDGDSLTLGGKIDSGLTYVKDTKEWRNTLVYNGATAKTASLPRYVKSADSLKYETIFLYGLESKPWLGPYAMASAETAAFIGEDVRAENKSYEDREDSSIVYNNSASTFKLTDAWTPLTTKESAGVFAKLVDKENTKVEVRLGVGAIQVEADDQFRLNDNPATADVIEVSELESFEQVGAETGIKWSGKWNDVSSYSLAIETLTPFSVDIDEGKVCDDCSEFELTNVDAKASMSTKINQWANVSYEFKAVKQPQLLDKYQTQHGLVVNVDYEVF